MIYAFNSDNLVRAAVLSALNVVPSSVVYRTDTDEKDGGGSVALTGSYTGASDATFDVRIAATASATPRVSSPVFSGVGNGTLSGLAVSGVDAQTFRVSLEDLGTRTRAAYTPFQSVTLFAQATGPGGNDITLTINASGLVDTATDFATQGEIRVGLNEYSGDEWNFGAARLNIDGTIPATAPRIRFGYDPQVYRAYRKYVAGQYVYGFSPAPVRNVKSGTPVYLVSGSRSIVITDGVDTETHTGIVSVYDALAKIRDDSDLVEVDGAIVNDLLPGGQGTTELSVWTQPYLVALEREGPSSFIEDADIDITLGAIVPTQTLTLQCVDVRTPGAEKWRVRGDVTGAMPDLTTGVEYTDSGYTITIPIVGDDPDVTRGSIRIEYSRPSNSDGSASLPSFEAFRPVIGAGARNSAWAFEYRPVPAADCSEVGDIIGGPSAACLGLNPGGGEIMSDASLSRRRQRLAAFVREFVQSNTASPPVYGSNSTVADIAYIKTAAQVLAQGLVDLGTATALVPDTYAISTVYARDAIVTPGNGHRYGANVASVTGTGTSAGTPPTFPTTVGATVADNDIVWENLGLVALGVWDAAYTTLTGDALELLGIAADMPQTMPQWTASTAVALDYVLIADANGLPVRFIVTTAGTTAATEPDWGTVTVIGNTIADGTAVWARVGGNLGPVPLGESYYERYETAMIEAKAAAGLSANFTNPNNQGDGCWGPTDMDHHWAYLGIEPYAPMDTGVYYHSSTLEQAPGGGTIARTTQEFAFGPRFGCPELLAAGDQIRIVITDVQGRSTYQQGDLVTIQTTRAVPLEFGGGQDGDDTLTFSVIGSVDGRLADYALDLTAPAGYSAGGVSFTITPGAIDFALGDRWDFAVEAAQFEWRKNAGSWSTAADITAAAVSLSDGLSAAFTSGVAPSWTPGDQWTFAAESINGVDRARQPTDGLLTWTTSTTITIEPSGDTAIEGVMLGDHTIPSDATITLQGSDDNFSSTPLNQVIAWRRGSIWTAVTADYAKYRITIDRGGSLAWLWCGVPTRLQIRTGVTELGRLVKRERLPGLAQRRGLGGTVEHEFLTQASVDVLLDRIESACLLDRRRFGIVPVESLADSAIVEYLEESIEFPDRRGYHPRDPVHRVLSVSLELSPIA